MNLLKLKYSLLFIFCILLSGCTDDFIEEGNGGELIGSGEESYIEFMVDLASMTTEGSSSSDLTVGSSLNFEQYEDYIDPENIRVLFFHAGVDEDDNRLDNYDTLIKAFDTGNGNEDNLSFIPIKNTTTSNTKEWYIRIPISDYNSDFAKALRKNKFKIAVLANWDWESIKTSEPVFKEKDPIKKLHHLSVATEDPYYKEEKKRKVYEFLFEGYNGQMGVYQDWVVDKFKKVNDDYLEARNWIRENWYPGYSGFQSGFEYKNLRVLWNFNGLINNSEEDYDYNKDAWRSSNRSDLLSWLSSGNGYNPESRLADLDPITDRFSFSFIGEEDGEGKKYSRLVTVNGKKGIALENGNYYVHDNSTIYQSNVIKMKLEASGRLFIKWGCQESDKKASLSIERRNNATDSQPNDKNDKNKGKNVNPEVEGQDIQIVEIPYEIDNLEEHLIIYSPGTEQGTPVIYEIEYIEDQHLTDTYRVAKQLGTDADELLIPMYGIQVFDKIENWKEGTVFGLSNFNQLTPVTPKKISMLRSVAKVELKLPRNTKEAPYHHVFLRCLNRTSRAEPVDVSTPTDKIWEDGTNDDGSHHSGCEWFKIRDFVEEKGPFYNGIEEGSTGYIQKLAWYYGAWADNHGNVGGVVPNPQDISDSPQIMNPMINRSDFAQFIYMGVEGIYDRYIIYVPEKFTDDPGTVDIDKHMSNQSPKVCHIEFRGKTDDIKNLDDDWCYRIYFTEGGFGDSRYFPNLSDTGQSTNPTWENKYEQKLENLKMHWPIMRNHVYSFTVTDTDSRILIMDLKVLPWKNVQEDNSYTW